MSVPKIVQLLAIAMGLSLCALAPVAVAAEPPDLVPAPEDRDVEPPDDPEDVEPSAAPDGVEPDPDASSGEDGAPPAKDTPHEGGDADKPPAPKLPKDGRADRPVMPHIDRDLIHPDSGIVGQASAQIDLSRVGEDLFLSLNLGTVLVHRKWRLAPRLPIRFRVVDEAPLDSGVVRKQDWDEVSDFARIIAFFQYGAVGEPIFARYGELNGVVVGHGSVINRYYNTVDLDHYQGGAYFLGDTGFLGGEILVDNLFDPNLVVGRPWVRPFDWLRALPFFLQKLKVGLTVGADFDAPLEVSRDEEGRVVQDDQFRAVVLESDVIPVLGLDLEVPIVSTPHLDVVPYADVATIDTEGVGLHVGTFINIRFTPLVGWRNRVEYRHQGPGYRASYVSPFYEIERLAFREGKTKLATLRDGGFARSRDGFYLESEFRISGLLRTMLVVADDTGPDNTDVLMRIHLPHLGPFRLALFFARLGFDGLDNFLDAKRTVVAASLRWNVADLFFVRGSVKNEWWLSHSPDGAGLFETTLDWDVGFGLLIKL